MDSLRFLMDTEIEVPAVTAEQIREVDCIASEETGPGVQYFVTDRIS